MKIKKILAMGIAGILAAAALSGCGDQTAQDPTSTGTAGNSSEKYKIGLCQLVQHQALDAATQGFEDKLETLLGKDNV